MHGCIAGRARRAAAPPRPALAQDLQIYPVAGQVKLQRPEPAASSAKTGAAAARRLRRRVRVSPTPGTSRSQRRPLPGLAGVMVTACLWLAVVAAAGQPQPAQQQQQQPPDWTPTAAARGATQSAAAAAGQPPAGIPADWVAPWAAGTLFFSKVTPRSWRHVHSQGASVGNGFLASVVDSGE